MDQRGVFYVSRLKLNNRIYKKNERPEYFRDGTMKKQSEFVQLDLEEMMNQIQPGETYEIPNAYIGRYKKLPARVVLYRLTDVQVRKRRKDQAYKEKKKGITYSDRSKRLTEITILPTFPGNSFRRNEFMIYTHYVGKWKSYLKPGSHFFRFIVPHFKMRRCRALRF
jgi:hypothetical protein